MSLSKNHDPNTEDNSQTSDTFIYRIRSVKMFSGFPYHTNIACAHYLTVTGTLHAVQVQIAACARPEFMLS